MVDTNNARLKHNSTSRASTWVTSSTRRKDGRSLSKVVVKHLLQPFALISSFFLVSWNRSIKELDIPTSNAATPPNWFVNELPEFAFSVDQPSQPATAAHVNEALSWVHQANSCFRCSYPVCPFPGNGFDPSALLYNTPTLTNRMRYSEASTALEVTTNLAFLDPPATPGWPPI